MNYVFWLLQVPLIFGPVSVCKVVNTTFAKKNVVRYQVASVALALQCL